MNDNLRQFVFGFVLLVFCAGLEELLPKFLGVGFPVLLSSVHALSVGGASLPIIIILAVVAGALEEAISTLPFLAAVSYFIFTALSARALGLPRLSAVLIYPCYQLWVSLWMNGSDAGIFSRLILSLPIGCLTAFCVGTCVSSLSRKGAIYEKD